MNQTVIPLGIPPFVITVIEALNRFFKWLSRRNPRHSD